MALAHVNGESMAKETVFAGSPLQCSCGSVITNLMDSDDDGLTIARVRHEVMLLKLEKLIHQREHVRLDGVIMIVPLIGGERDRSIAGESQVMKGTEGQTCPLAVTEGSGVHGVRQVSDTDESSGPVVVRH